MSLIVAIAMLFVARCFDLYTNEKGKLSFLTPFTIYKTQAGAGFRNWVVNNCEIQKIHDLVELYPFEGALTRTAMIVIAHGKTKFPIPCVMWSNPRTRGIDMEAELSEAKKMTKQFDMIFAPIRKGEADKPWMIISDRIYEKIRKMMKESQYKGYVGVYAGLNSAYYLNLIEKRKTKILIENIHDIGKIKIPQIKTTLENELIYPVLRGRDISKWYSKPSSHIIIPHSLNGKTIGESELKINFYFFPIESLLETYFG